MSDIVSKRGPSIIIHNIRLRLELNRTTRRTLIYRDKVKITSQCITNV